MPRQPIAAGSIRKLIEFDGETWAALQGLMRDEMKDIQEVADEAFTDLLKKYGRPVSLRDALQASVRTTAANDQPHGRGPRSRERGARKPR